MLLIGLATLLRGCDLILHLLHLHLHLIERVLESLVLGHGYTLLELALQRLMTLLVPFKLRHGCLHGALQLKILGRLVRELFFEKGGRFSAFGQFLFSQHHVRLDLQSELFDGVDISQE